MLSIPIAEIRPNENQPRKRFDAEPLQALAESIKSRGLLQPILVRALGPTSFQIIAGERRWQAAKLAGLSHVPAIVRAAESAQDQLLMALVENLQREDLNAIEEARAFETMASRFAMSHEQIAQRVGRSRAAVSNALRLLMLPEEIMLAIEEGRVASGQVRPLIALPKSEALRLFRRLVTEGLSARDVERIVGASPESDVRKKDRKPASPSIADVEERLSRQFGRSVRIRGSEKKGCVQFDYYSKDDLIQLVDQLLESE